MAKDAADKPKTAGRYRKVEVRTWGDAKFRRLSPIPPCGQGLWLFLITGPHTGPIPGLFRAGRASLAEELGWEVEAFDEAFGEAFGEGMVEADFRARVVWIPKAISHNKPESPNVVRSWSSEFDLIPECELKWKALEALKSSIHALGEAYGKAFDEAFGKPSGKPSRKTSPNQEQEQEQEQEKNTPLPPKGEECPGFADFWRAWPKGDRKQAKGECLKAWKKAGAEPHAALIVAHVERMKASDDWRRENGRYVPAPLVYLHQKRWDGADGEEGARAANGRNANGHADDWWRRAGYVNRWEAENDGCWPHTADQFRDGKPLGRPS